MSTLVAPDTAQAAGQGTLFSGSPPLPQVTHVTQCAPPLLSNAGLLAPSHRGVAAPRAAHYNPGMNLGDLQEPAVHEDVEQLEALEPPYKVFVHNDNVTPYDFVVMALLRFFGLTSLEAEQVTYLAHISGVAYVTTLPRSEAEKRVGRAQFAASLEGYPLTFSMEPE